MWRIARSLVISTCCVRPRSTRVSSSLFFQSARLMHNRSRSHSSWQTLSTYSSSLFSTASSSEDQSSANETKKSPQENVNSESSSDVIADEARMALEIKVRELNEKNERLVRAFADMENEVKEIRRRSAMDVQQASKFALSSFAKNLLEVADNLERALGSVPSEILSGESATNSNVDPRAQLLSLFEGVQMVEKEFISSLAKEGIVSFGSVGEKFDPFKHNALFEMDHAEYQPGSVGLLVKRGYMIKDRILRPADVGVVRQR